MVLGKVVEGVWLLATAVTSVITITSACERSLVGVRIPVPSGLLEIIFMIYPYLLP
jgi:hypothetical protein